LADGDDARRPDDTPDDVRDGAHARGMAVRRRVLGDRHVDRAEAAKTGFDADFQRFITEGAWGSVWARPGLTPRERSLVTLALLAAGGHHGEVAMHARATANTGATPDDLKEVLLHVAVYAGVPAANEAFRIVKQTLQEEGRLEPAAEGEEPP
jgi:4-carboxymuconolactone decarboxylase